MSISPSTVVSLPLPRWAYVPGESADAAPDHDTLWQAKALVPSQFRGFVPARHPALRYGIQIANANLKLRMNKPHAAVRLFGEALGELNALGARMATVAGGGFADVFPIAALTAVLQIKLGKPSLSASDWMKIGPAGRT